MHPQSEYDFAKIMSGDAEGKEAPRLNRAERTRGSEAKPCRDSRRGTSAATGYSLEFQQHDFRIRSEAQGRTPGSGAARGEDLHFADATQAVDELPVDAPCDPTPGNELTEMRVTGELQGETCGFGDFGIVRSVGQKDAGAIAIEMKMV